MTSLPEIGVCVHPSFGLAATTKALSYLGVTRVRYDVPMALTGFETGLCDAGINVCGIIASFGDGTPKDMQAQLANLRKLQQRRPGSVSAIEGPNEVNNFPVHEGGRVDPKTGDTGQRVAVKGMFAALLAVVAGDPVLSGVRPSATPTPSR